MINEEKNVDIEIVVEDVLETTLPGETKAKKETSTQKNSSDMVTKTFNSSNIKLGLRLCIFVTAVVLALSVVNFFTAPVVEKNRMEKGNVARQELVSEATDFTLYEGKIPDCGKNVSEIYIASKDGADIAYCLNVSTAGFGGDIDLVVAIDEAMKVRGVKVISHSETPNIGASVLEEKSSLLAQYKNISVSAVDSVVAVSGATVTSTAVKAAVKEAIETVTEMEKGAMS